jgi:hypothetical protein
VICPSGRNGARLRLSTSAASGLTFVTIAISLMTDFFTNWDSCCNVKKTVQAPEGLKGWYANQIPNNRTIDWIEIGPGSPCTHFDKLINKLLSNWSPVHSKLPQRIA